MVIKLFDFEVKFYSSSKKYIISGRKKILSKNMEGTTAPIKHLTVQEALQEVGQYGRCQKFLCFFFFLMHIPVAMQILIAVFLTVTPEWRCRENSTVCIYNGTFIAEDPRKCVLPRDSWRYVGLKGFSVTSQFDVSCEASWLVMLFTSLFFFGWGTGALIMGYIADNFGRKTIIFPCFFSIILLGSISTLLPNIYLIMVCRFFIGFFVQGTSLQGMVIVSELVGPGQRPLATILIVSAAGVGWSLLALQAYLLQNWKHLSLMCTLPYLLLIPLLRYVPESIEWLNLRGKDDKVIQVLKMIARINGKRFPGNIRISFSGVLNNTRRRVSTPVDLFRTWNQTLETIKIGYVWIATLISYFGMYIAANQLGGSLYRDFAILSVLDLPVIPLSVFVCKRFGRKACVVFPLLFGSLICISTGLIPNENDWLILRVTFGLIGGIFFSLAFNGLYIWTVELFPTHIRSTGMGFGMICSRMGSGVVPWIVGELSGYGYWCSFVALGIPSFIAFFVGLALHDTKKEKPIIENE